LRAWQEKNEKLFSGCRQKDLDKFSPLARLLALPANKAAQTKPKTKMKNRYEILDTMECVVATAESFTDAIYAAEKYAPAMIYNVITGKVIFFQ